MAHTQVRMRVSAVKKIAKKCNQVADAYGIIIALITIAIIALHGRQTIALTVSNIGDRPIQVGSHCHFFEANRALKFDREQSYGFRLQVPAGTAVRFEPGESKRVTLVALGGNRIAYGINGLVNGKLDDAAVKQKAFQTAREQGFAGKNT